MSDKPLDAEGVEFKVGDYFISAQGSRSSVHLQRYVVEAIEKGSDVYRSDFWILRSRYCSKKIDGVWYSDTKLSRIVALNRCVILPKPF